MAHAATPSRRKFKLARAIAKRLHDLLGDDLKAVFVVGSVAANMAHKESDLDFIVVGKNYHGTHEGIWQVRESMKLQGTTEFIAVDMNDFEKLSRVKDLDVAKAHLALVKMDQLRRIRNLTSIGTAYLVLRNGAVPVFGREYATVHKDCWHFPELESIRKIYYKGNYPQIIPRIGSKRSRKGMLRFLK